LKIIWKEEGIIMTSFRIWKLPSRYIAVLFMAVGAVSAIALIWMGVRLFQQDRALEAQRLEEQREAAADRIGAALEKILSDEEQKLMEAQKLADKSMVNLNPAAEDFLLVNIGSGEVLVWPENGLLYYPVIPPGHEASSIRYVEVERAEFQDQDYERAVNALHPLSGAEDPATRIGAQLRLARNLRKAGRFTEALDTYGEMAKSSDQGISISGVPADLVARRARCVLLEELENWEQLEIEAQSLRDDLIDRRWHLDRASYIYYSGQVGEWLGNEYKSGTTQQALADAVIWLWQKWQAMGKLEQESSGRESFRLHDTSVAVLWRVSNGRLAAVVAGPRYQLSQWFDPTFGNPDFSGVSMGLMDSDGLLAYGDEPTEEIPLTTRLSSSTDLPWNITVANSDLESDRNQFAQRRRLMMMGLGMLALLVIAASYFIARAVSRELAAARLQSDFVSAVSHEFRTPLTSMRQFTEMLVEDENLPAGKRRRYYKAQERATRRLSRLVESLLDFGRMEAGARPYRLEPLDLGRLVRSVVEEFKQEVDSNHLVMDCNTQDEGPKVNGDRDALAQALWNLLDNAVKYSSDRPSIQIEVETGNQVSIRVRDRGVGIPESEKSRILRKFTRGSSAEMLGIKGTGIGLAMVKHIVDAHGGKVLIDSEPGKGSTFTIRLPVGGRIDG
jgi:signal transduction histidine kinase